MAGGYDMKKYLLLLFVYIVTGSLVYSQFPSSPILVEPPPKTSVVSLTPTLSWKAVDGADCYFIFITTDTNLSATLETCMTTVPNYSVPEKTLITDEVYYWYVKAHNSYGWGEASPYFSFRTISTSISGCIVNLQNQVIDLTLSENLPSNQANILINRLNQAIIQLNLNHNFYAALNMGLFKLRVFILRISDVISVDAANSLNYSADGVIDLIQDLNKIIHNPVLPAKEFSLLQNYPNPFNPLTTIEYTIPENSVVSLKIYDILGKEVASLVNKFQNQGSYIVNWNASQFSSGVYIYKLTAGNFSDTKKMVLSK